MVVDGSGSDTKGKYFTFIDNASQWAVIGTSPQNKLYYDPVAGNLIGSSAASSAQGYQYTVTQIRKSK